MIRAALVVAWVIGLISLPVATVYYERDQVETEHKHFTVPPLMTLSDMTARSAMITGRLMECFGEAGAAQCRPVGVSQTEHPEVVVGPVTVCFDGACRLASEAK